MGRAPCCDKVGLKRGPWQPEEDEKLISYIRQHGHENWRALPQKAGLARCGKSCRLRWTNYLRPDIKRGGFSIEEDHMIIQLHAILGNRWSVIAAHMPGRTDNEIKNYWNTHLRKQLVQMGIDPITHRFKHQMPDSSSSVFNQMALWENARLHAEARLAREYLNFMSNKKQPMMNNGSKNNEQVFTAWLEEYFKTFGKYLDSSGSIVVGGGGGGGGGGGEFESFSCWPRSNPEANAGLNFQPFGGAYGQQPQFSGMGSPVEFGASTLSTSDGSFSSDCSLPQLTEHDVNVNFMGSLEHGGLTVDNVGLTADEYDAIAVQDGGSSSSLLHGTMLENISRDIPTELDLVSCCIAAAQDDVCHKTTNCDIPSFELNPLDQHNRGMQSAAAEEEEVDLLEFTKTESIPNNSEYWSTILKIVGT